MVQITECDLCGVHTEYDCCTCSECNADVCEECEIQCYKCDAVMCEECSMLNDNDEYYCSNCFDDENFTSDEDEEEEEDTEDTMTSDDDEAVGYNGDGRIYWPSGRISPDGGGQSWYLCLECGEHKDTKKETCRKCGSDFRRTGIDFEKTDEKLTEWGCETWPALKPARPDGADVTIGQTINPKNCQRCNKIPATTDHPVIVGTTVDCMLKVCDDCDNAMDKQHSKPKEEYQFEEVKTNAELVSDLIPSEELFKPRKILCDRCYTREGTVKYEGGLRGEAGYWRICRHCWDLVEEWTDPESSDSDSESDDPSFVRTEEDRERHRKFYREVTLPKLAARIKERDDLRKRDMEENSPPPSPKKQKVDEPCS